MCKLECDLSLAFGDLLDTEMFGGLMESTDEYIIWKRDGFRGTGLRNTFVNLFTYLERSRPILDGVS